MSRAVPERWTYAQTAQHISEIAAVFHSTVAGEPRVAIVCDNGVESACCDLACLLYDIVDTPLNPLFDAETLASIFDRLHINIAVTDTEERRRRLEEVRDVVSQPFTVYVVDRNIPLGTRGARFLGDACRRLTRADIDQSLGARERHALDRVATVMFTSGSTGEPKGVSFSLYNLVSKRFARAAALPGVGRDEVLLCYLPLYHTFGRYLEMLGTIYWGGTYVFAGSRSSDRLFSLFAEINPTGFVSVPIRWVQLHERAMERMSGAANAESRGDAFRSITGHRLRWGLSAAGYLSPRVFRFFETNGVELCSGFGMTEATGGVTMTPPGAYVDNTTGVALPGVRTRLGRDGELEISGHYVAWPLEEKGPGDVIPFPTPGTDGYWVPTGDIFRIHPDGNHEIVDRIKDIYKNSRGQTVAPRKLESKFAGVPGVKRAYLVGDGRPYNVLLIVPDPDEPLLANAPTPGHAHEYFRELVAAANQGLASYERAVSFALLDRDFDAGELSPKGTFKRRVIEAHFAEQIEALYERDFVSIPSHDLDVRIPQWLFRDLGILNDDIYATGEGLVDRVSGRELALRRNTALDLVRVGDLEYRVDGTTLDLGLFARQPLLWVGNPALIAFCPCKDGWDVPLGGVSPQTFRRTEASRSYALEDLPSLDDIGDPILIIINKLVSLGLHGDKEAALHAIGALGAELKDADDNIAEVIWRRLEALSHHPDEDVRCLAYQTLLLDEPSPDFSNAFPTFALSGLSFVNEDTIRNIAFANVEQRRLEALRKRLFTYRTQLHWPAEPNARRQLANILKLLAEFAREHPAFFDSARSELASWVLHDPDRDLARAAGNLLAGLHRQCESRSATPMPRGILAFAQGMAPEDIAPVETLLANTTFLRQSVFLAYDDRAFDVDNVDEGGIRISPLKSPDGYRCCRMSIHTREGRHYDMRLTLCPAASPESVRSTLHWHASLSGYPLGTPVVPRLGCHLPDLRAYSARWPGEPTLRERLAAPRHTPETDGALRVLFTRGLEAFFTAWRHSGGEIVPGNVSPDNVVVPDVDLPDRAWILSLTGWTEYHDALSLIRPMIENFYRMPAADNPDVRWIFDACVEALDDAAAAAFFDDLEEALEREHIEFPVGAGLSSALRDYRAGLRDAYHAPFSVVSAVERYQEWERSNPEADEAVREQTVLDIYDAYQLARFPEIARYYLYRNTYFSKADTDMATAFDGLLVDMMRAKDKPVVQMASLSRLQATIDSGADRDVFARMVFPGYPARMDVLEVGEFGAVVVRSEIVDARGAVYTCTETAEPAEIAGLCRLFFLEHQPFGMSVENRHFAVFDAQERVVGGVCYRFRQNDVVRIEALVVESPLRNRGVGAAMLEDFCARMAARSKRAVKAPMISGEFFRQCGFERDRRWSGFVRSLATPDGQPVT